MSLMSRKESRARRHERIRKKIAGTQACPRMAIALSNRFMYVQFIDDEKSATLAAATTLGREGCKNNVEAAGVFGRDVGNIALSKGIVRAVVDRSGFRYHGRVQAIVEGARAAGLQIGKTKSPGNVTTSTEAAGDATSQRNEVAQ